MEVLIFLKLLSLRVMKWRGIKSYGMILNSFAGPKGGGQGARSNLQKSGIRYEITTVTLFPRNDGIFGLQVIPPVIRTFIPATMGKVLITIDIGSTSTI